MSTVLFALGWWCIISTVVVAAALIAAAVCTHVREWFWNRDRRQHIATMERREQNKAEAHIQWAREQAAQLGAFAKQLQEIRELPESVDGPRLA